MAKYVMKNAKIEFSFDSGTTWVNWSNQFRSLTLPVKAEEVDSGVFGDSSMRATAGLIDNRIQLEYVPDADQAKLTILLQAIGTEIMFRADQKNTTVSASNLRFSGTFLNTGGINLGGNRGELANTGSLDFRINGGLTITDGTTPFTIG